MRSWFLLIALSAMLVLVAACSSDDDATDDVPAEDDTAAEVQPTETPAPEPTEEPEPTETPEPEPTEPPEPTPEPEPTEAPDETDVDDQETTPSGDGGELAGLLLNLDDLPEGWSQVSESFGEDDFGGASDEPFEAPCGIEPIGESFETIAEGDRSFQGTELGPYLSQNLLQMGSDDEAEQVMSVMREMFGCEEWTESDEFGEEMTFTIEEVPFDGVGDDSFAVVLGISLGDESPELDMFGDLAFDVVIFQRGEFVTMLLYFDIFGMSEADFDAVLRIADDKLQGQD